MVTLKDFIPGNTFARFASVPNAEMNLVSDPNSSLEEYPYGITVIGSLENGLTRAIIGTWSMQVSFSPPLFVAAIENGSLLLNCIEQSRVFSINLLGRAGIETARQLLKGGVGSGGYINGVPVRKAKNGAPLLPGALLSISCDLTELHPAGDHTLCVGHVVESALSRDGDPLLLSDTGWHYRPKRR
jgi:flavin reductase (DIM6/NTAB) family NADH-FMN oxidoreductase RutF